MLEFESEVEINRKTEFNSEVDVNRLAFGGSGGSINYTKLQSVIKTTDWVVTSPSWIGQDALTWSANDGVYYIQGGTEDLGLVAGSAYTATMTIDGTDYEPEYSEVMEADGMPAYVAQFNSAVILQILDHCAGFDTEGNFTIGNGYYVMVIPIGETVPSSVIVKSFSAAGGIYANINNSAIKTNSAATLYINYAGVIDKVSKEDGIITLTSDSVPTQDIPFDLEIFEIDKEGLFEIINNYIPSVPEIPEALPQKTSAVKTGTWTAGEEHINIFDSDITSTSDVDVNISHKGEVIGELANSGAFTLASEVVPTSDIQFTYKVKQTNGTGQINIINSFTGAVGAVIEGSLPTSGWAVGGFIHYWKGEKTCSSPYSMSGSNNAAYIGTSQSLATKMYADTTAKPIVDYKKSSSTRNTQEFKYYGTINVYSGSAKGTGRKYTERGYSSDASIIILENGEIYGQGVNDWPRSTAAITVYGIGISTETARTYTISDTAIKTNSTVTMYLNSEDEVRAYSKTDGSVVVEMDSVPTTAIPYTLQVVETDTEGTFEVVNSYIPVIKHLPQSVYNEKVAAISDISSGSPAAWVSGAELFNGNISIDDTSPFVVKADCTGISQITISGIFHPISSSAVEVEGSYTFTGAIMPPQDGAYINLQYKSDTSKSVQVLCTISAAGIQIYRDTTQTPLEITSITTESLYHYDIEDSDITENSDIEVFVNVNGYIRALPPKDGILTLISDTNYINKYNRARYRISKVSENGIVTVINDGQNILRPDSINVSDKFILEKRYNSVTLDLADSVSYWEDESTFTGFLNVGDIIVLSLSSTLFTDRLSFVFRTMPFTTVLRTTQIDTSNNIIDYYISVLVQRNTETGKPSFTISSVNKVTIAPDGTVTSEIVDISTDTVSINSINILKNNL